MSDSRIIETIAEALYEYAGADAREQGFRVAPTPFSDLPESFKESWRPKPRAVLAALKASRVALVELPEPTVDQSSVASFEWREADPLVAGIFDDDPHRVYLRDKDHPWDHGADPISPLQARQLAAALIAAADVADAAEARHE